MKPKLNDILFVGIILFLVVTGINAAVYLYSADEVSYNNSNSNLTSTNVQDALDVLYTKCNNSTTNLPNNHSCTQKTDIKCKRATVLHTEICSNNNDSRYWCKGDGYALNSTITYGNSTTIEGVLTTGDAFDCDVNGDGTFDSTTERFYYVSDYFDVDRKKFNDTIAVLIYYSNTIAGVASTSNVAYASQADAQAVGTCIDTYGCNNYGPITAIRELPTTTQWPNIRLYKETRKILTQNGATEIEGVPLPTNFSYSGYAARLLTNQEQYPGCYDFYTGRVLKKCNFLFERTTYADWNLTTTGIWTETPYISLDGYDAGDNVVCILEPQQRVESYDSAGMSNDYGVRPAIEVPKSQILY